MIRFVYFFNYGEGVSLEEGDRWYRSVHVPAVREIDGVVRYRSWPCVDVGLPYPSPGIVTPLDQFVRRSELVFASKEQGLKAIRENVHLWAVAEKGEVGFNEVECVFLEEEPQYNLLRDAPPEHYKYMTLKHHFYAPIEM